MHPLILPGKHTFTRLLIRTEHYRLLHAGPTLIPASLVQRFTVAGERKAIHDVMHSCVICDLLVGKTCSKLLDQSPAYWFKMGSIFDRVGVDCAGPVFVKLGYTCRPTITMAYACVLITFSFKLYT